MTAGSAPAFSASFGNNNRMVGYSYDNNGNQLTTPGGAFLEYDADNHMTTYVLPGAVNEYYEYHPSGWRVWKGSAPATLYLHGPGGQLLCSYSGTGGGTYTEPVSFAGRLVYTFRGGTDASGNLDYDTIRTDRLGSTRAVNGVARNYYPFGEEITSTSNDQYKFASTYRDSATGLDYAINRYYASGTARFTTPDPYQASGGAGAPQNWNRYSYVHNDPVNFRDPWGLLEAPPGMCPAEYENCGGWDWFGIGFSWGLGVIGGGGTSAPPPPPLTCTVDSWEVFPIATVFSDGSAGWFQPVRLKVHASGGDPSLGYSWGHNQTVRRTGTIAFTDGSFVRVDSTEVEQTAQRSPVGDSRTSIITDAPGVKVNWPNGNTVESFYMHFDFSLLVWVTNGSQTAYCGSFQWTVDMALVGGLPVSTVNPTPWGHP